MDGSAVRGWRRGARDGAPTVVFLHGWVGYCAGPHRILYELADALAQAGLGTARFDFRGRGDSDGRFSEATFRRAVEDTRAVSGLLAREMGADRQDMVGLCFGATVGFRCLELWRRAILVSPEILHQRRSWMTRAGALRRSLPTLLRRVLSPSTWYRAATGRTSVAKAMTFYSRSEKLPYEPEVPRFAPPAARSFVVCGTADPTAPESSAQYAEHSRRLGVPCEVAWIEGAQHNYSSREAKSKLFQRVTAQLTDQDDLLDI